MTRKRLVRCASVTALTLLFAVTGAERRSARPRAAGVITVTTTAQGVNPSDGKCSLQEAIYSANFDAAVAPVSYAPYTTTPTECEAGSGDDVIVLQPGAVYPMTSVEDDPYNPIGPAATPVVLSTIIIEANGAQLVRANPNRDFSGPIFRLFAVSHTASADPDGDLPLAGDGTGRLTIRNAYIKGFVARGGNGATGGGGGLGAGGAIFVVAGVLTIESSTFQDNGAGGGNGSAGVAGGGGGMRGNGGAGFQQTFGDGGAGGGSRGNGGAGDFFDPGGGGGTLSDGDSAPTTSGAPKGGFRCGGDAGQGNVLGFNHADGYDGCPGGGGGGGVSGGALFETDGNGGTGGFAGGGGGGGYPLGDGGHGGFGGGGGAGWTYSGTSGSSGGNAGFGGGGGAGEGGEIFGGPGAGGTFGGDGSSDFGGGGAGLGGAIFGYDAHITVYNSTFTGNYVLRGVAGGATAQNGTDAGAIFAVDGILTVLNSTITANESTGSSAGIVMYRSTELNSATFVLRNTIVANNIPLADECNLLGGTITHVGSGNLITDNGNCPGSTSADPQLGPLQINPPGITPTMAIGPGSPALNVGDNAQCTTFDQRGVTRPQGLGCDIGAYEYISPLADLSIAAAPLGTAVAGSDLAFAINAANNGPTDAPNTVMTVGFPAGTTLVSLTGGSGFACSGAGPVICEKGTMAAGEQALFTLTVHLPSSMAAGTTLTTQAKITSDAPDPTGANNVASATVTVITRADLAIAKSGAATPLAGADVAYTMSVSNNGPSDAHSVTVADTLPAGTTFQSVSSPPGWSCSLPSAGASPVVVSCSVSTFAAGGSGFVTVVMRLGASLVDGSVVCNDANITSTTTDPVASNNTLHDCSVVQTRADLVLSQTAVTSGTAGKGTATFNLTARNNGPSDSQHVSLVASSSLFEGPSRPQITASGGATCTVAGPTVTCLWNTLAATATGTATIAVPWRSAVGKVCDSVTVSAGTIDPNATNNTSSACVGKK